MFSDLLKLRICPHCSISHPNLESEINTFSTYNHIGENTRLWNVYVCHSCGGVITSSSQYGNKDIVTIYPDNMVVNKSLPLIAKTFLQQALESTYTPTGSIMLSAKAINIMLKEKGLKFTNLLVGIRRAVKKNLIPLDMETWANQIFLNLKEVNNPKDSLSFPTIEDAKQTLEFTKLLAEYLYVMPAKVRSGVEATMPVVVEEVC